LESRAHVKSYTSTACLTMSKKNALEFDKTQPAFLRRLRGEISGQVDDPDRHVNQVARPTRPKRLEADEDDGPTYVMEDTYATLTKEEYEALVNGDSKDAKGDAPAEEKMSLEGNEKPKPTTQKMAGIGATKKRKAAKIIGVDEEDQIVKDVSLGKPDNEASGTLKSTEKKALKKKKTKVKIDFGDGEET
jgi:hypothetical protein